MAYLSVAMVLLKQAIGVRETGRDRRRAAAMRRTPLLCIGANSHQMDAFGMLGRECLDARRLTMYITKPMDPLAMARLGLRVRFRGVRGASAF